MAKLSVCFTNVHVVSFLGCIEKRSLPSPYLGICILFKVWTLISDLSFGKSMAQKHLSLVRFYPEIWKVCKLSINLLTRVSFSQRTLWTLFAGNALIRRKSLGIWTKMLNYLIVFMFKVQFKLHNQVNHTFKRKYEKVK